MRVPGLTALLMPGNAWPQLWLCSLLAQAAQPGLLRHAGSPRAGWQPSRTAGDPDPRCRTGWAQNQHHLHHPPGSALRRDSLPGTVQLPRCFSQHLSWGCPDIPVPPPPQPRPPVLPVGQRLVRCWSGSVPRLLPLSQHRVRTRCETAQRSHGMKSMGHSPMPGCVTQCEGVR